MLIKYFKTLFLLIPLIVLISLINNFIKILDKNLSIFQNISLLFEATSLTKSDVLSVIDFQYNSKVYKNSLKKIYLEIEPSSIEKSKFNITKNSKEKNYYDAKLKFNENDNPQKIKFRIRGRNHWHHRLEKPSLRLKLKKEEPYNMMQHINLVSPEGRTVIENYYPDMVAKKFGLVGHYGELIELIINNKSYGIYHLISREDESMVRLNKRMPGPLLLGKYLNEIWNLDDFEIINEQSIDNTQKIYQRMIEAINIKKENLNWNSQEKLWMIMNFDQTAKFFAINNILGILHNDYFHNQEFYFDPTKGKVEPIISDAMSLGTFVYLWGKRRFSINTLLATEKPNYKISINQKTNPLLNRAIIDPEFNHRRINYLYQLIKNELNFQNQKKYLQNLYSLIDETVYRDNKKNYLTLRIGGWNPTKYSNLEYEIFKKNVFYFIENRNTFIENEIKKEDILINFLKIEEYSNKNFIKIQYKGYSGINLSNDQKNFISFIKPENNKLQKISSNNMKLYSGLKIVNNDKYHTNMDLGDDIFHTKEYDTDYQTYILEINENNFDKINFENSLVNLLTNERVNNFVWLENENKNISDVKYNEYSLHIWNKRKSNFKEIVTLGPGLIELKENLTIQENQILKILPKTQILMHPNVSILSRGKTIVDGTDGKIELIRQNNDAPWGVFAIIGKKSNGSIFKNVKISGGSSDIIENIKFSGMISFFWNEKILLRNLNVSNNELGDDTIHFSNSKGQLNNVDVSNCFGDCIDFDYSDYKIENLKISNSRNDGLDFMESKIVGKYIDIYNAKDKAISAGENSNINLFKVDLRNSITGVAVKDLSNVSFNKVNFSNNTVAIDIYRKNWRYGKEGIIDLTNYKFNNNIVDISCLNSDDLKIDLTGLNVQEK